MKVVHWLKKPGETFKMPDPLCELLIDGRTDVLRYDDDEPLCGLYFHLVNEGEEVGPWGELFEYNDVQPGFTGIRTARESVNLRKFRGTYTHRPAYPQIFLNYRRADSQAFVNAVYEQLWKRFGDDKVFLDKDNIDPGNQWAWELQQAAAHCALLVPFIGPEWLTIADQQGRRRLDSETDFVRREIGAALDRNTPVIPVILPGASVPELRDLPLDIQRLVDSQALQLPTLDADSSAKRLIEAIEPMFRQ
jgi:hypothetical protein